MDLLTIGVSALVGAVIGFFVSRANGEGTDLDKLADKVDEKWDEKVKPQLDKLEVLIKKVEEKVK